MWPLLVAAVLLVCGALLGLQAVRSLVQHPTVGEQNTLTVAILASGADGTLDATQS